MTYILIICRFFRIKKTHLNKGLLIIYNKLKFKKNIISLYKLNELFLKKDLLG